MTTASPATSADGFHATQTAQRADELVRALFEAVNADDSDGTDAVLSRSLLSYEVHGMRTRTGLKRYFSGLHQSFSDLRFEVHENVGVLVDNDLVAVRTIITGTHSGDYAGVPATGASIQTSASHVFRVKDDKLAEHWLIVDTYRILVALGAIPGVANAFQQILGVAESPGGLFPERLGTRFDAPVKRQVAREESRSAVRRLYDGVFTTGNVEDVDAVAEGYIQNSGWTPDGRDVFAKALAISRGAMPDGLALQTHVIAEGNRISSRSVWDGTVTGNGRAADFTAHDFFRIDEDGRIAEHWETVDWVRLYQSFGMLPDDVRDL